MAPLAPFGAQWTTNGGALSRSSPYSSNDLGGEVDQAVAAALSTMLGGIPVVKASGAQKTMLYPPMAVVAFLVLIPEPALGTQLDALSWRLDGLGARADEHGPAHVAEAMCFTVWDPATGNISPTLPDPAEHPNLRIEGFAKQVDDAYRLRYAGSPPH
jgi:hypothetical protein